MVWLVFIGLVGGLIWWIQAITKSKQKTEDELNAQKAGKRKTDEAIDKYLEEKRLFDEKFNEADSANDYLRLSNGVLSSEANLNGSGKHKKS